MKVSPEVRELIVSITSQPLVYVSREEYWAIVNFLSGYDHTFNLIGLWHDVPGGFYDWLLAKLKRTSYAKGWPGLVSLMLPEENYKNGSPGREKELIRGLGDLLLEFIDETETEELPNDTTTRLSGRALVEHIALRPAMWVARTEFYRVVDYLNGYDLGCGLLDLHNGFRGWLLKKLQIESTAAWPELALQLSPGYDPNCTEKTFPDREEELIRSLGDLLLEYLDKKENDSQIA